MTQTEALKSAIEFAEFCLEEIDLSYMASNQAKRLVEKAKEALAQPEQKLDKKIEDLLEAYWRLAFDEGKTGKSHGDAANEVLFALRSLYTTPPQPKEPEQEPASEDREFWLSVVEGLDKKPESPTQGMTLGQRISHVGGRENSAGYIEFGSVNAVWALISHFLRDNVQPQSKVDDLRKIVEGFLEFRNKPEQEPVANVVLRDDLPTLLKESDIKPTDERLYTTPPQRKPLTLDQIEKIFDENHPDVTGQPWWIRYAKAIEAAHGIAGDA